MHADCVLLRIVMRSFVGRHLPVTSPWNLCIGQRKVARHLVIRKMSSISILEAGMLRNASALLLQGACLAAGLETVEAQVRMRAQAAVVW